MAAWYFATALAKQYDAVLPIRFRLNRESTLDLIVTGWYPAHYLYYYRDIDKKEVDILLVKNGSIYPVEIKKGIAPNKPTKNFNVLKKFGMPVMRGMVIENTDKVRAINDYAFAFPVSLVGI